MSTLYVDNIYPTTGSFITFSTDSFLAAMAFANPTVMSTNITVPTNYYARVNGPYTVAEGKTLTLQTGSVIRVDDI